MDRVQENPLTQTGSVTSSFVYVTPQHWNFCPQCGRRTRDGENYCPDCGTLLLRDYPAPFGYPVEPHSPTWNPEPWGDWMVTCSSAPYAKSFNARASC